MKTRTILSLSILSSSASPLTSSPACSSNRNSNATPKPCPVYRCGIPKATGTAQCRATAPSPPKGTPRASGPAPAAGTKYRDWNDGNSGEGDDAHADERQMPFFSSHRFILVSRSPYFHSALVSRPSPQKPLSFFLSSSLTASKPLTLTLPSPRFTPASLHFTLGFLYTGTLLFSHRTYDLSTALSLLLPLPTSPSPPSTPKPPPASSPKSKWRTASSTRSSPSPPTRPSPRASSAPSAAPAANAPSASRASSHSPSAPTSPAPSSSAAAGAPSWGSSARGWLTPECCTLHAG
ncbi:hypothetical protein B0H11DRAFT_2335758 [Mycena galericulata]|nr:hypothetical protein B0H11DRAFT_2335758 [Mycena galericulata]